MNIKLEIRERIVRAANALVIEGFEEPTNEQVRNRMGSGSLTHISPVMREWREAKKNEIAAVLTMPPELKKTVESSLGQVWAVASRLASAQVESLQCEAQAKVEAASEERDEALIEISRLETRIAELAETLAAKKHALTQAKTEREKQQHNGVRLAAENATLSTRLEERNTQLENLSLAFDALRADNRQLQAELIKIANQVKAPMVGQMDEGRIISTTVELACLGKTADNTAQKRARAPV